MVTIQTLLDGIPEKIRERQAQKVVLEKEVFSIVYTSNWHSLLFNIRT